MERAEACPPSPGGASSEAAAPRVAAARRPELGPTILPGFEGWLDRAARLFPALARDRGALLAQLGLLRARGARLEAPLVILLAGGTGAGKSTLLNALAGSEIAAASPVRPTTTELTCYVHRANELAVAGELARARVVAHERAELLDKAILDAPDFDSSARENEAALRGSLAQADLVIVLATPEKYADADLYALLDEYRAGRSFVFVLNRLDLGIASEVFEDFRLELARAGFEEPRLLVLSAREAFRRKTGGAVAPRGNKVDEAPLPGMIGNVSVQAAKAFDRVRGGCTGGATANAPKVEDAPHELQRGSAAQENAGRERILGDFDELEAIVEEELTRARIREIKRLNVDALARRLVELAAGRLPGDLDERLAIWRERAFAVVEELRAEIAVRFALLVREDRALEHDLEARFATAPYGGPFGFYQALAWAVRGLRGAGLRPGASHHALSDAPRIAPDEEDRRTASAVALAARRMGDLGAEQGLEAPDTPLAAGRAVELVMGARLEADRAIAAALAAIPVAGRSGRGLLALESLAMNILPVGIPAFALERWLEALARGELLGSSWFVAALLVVVAVLAVEGAIADALGRRRARALRRKLEGAAAAAVEEGIARPLLSRLEASLGEAEGAAAALEGFREGGPTPPHPRRRPPARRAEGRGPSGP